LCNRNDIERVEPWHRAAANAAALPPAVGRARREVFDRLLFAATATGYFNAG
jgi:hypothetical protein